MNQPWVGPACLLVFALGCITLILLMAWLCWDEDRKTRECLNGDKKD